jgi:hypothetical protein
LADNTNGEEFPELSRLLLDPERSQNLRLPNIFSFLPYLLNNPLSTVPAFVVGQGKTHGINRYIFHEIHDVSQMFSQHSFIFCSLPAFCYVFILLLLFF